MKNNALQFSLFVLVAVLGLTGPVVVFVVSAVIYAFLYAGIELIVLAAIIDAYFGYGGSGMYVYTLVTGVGLLCIQALKPYLLMYQQ